MPNQAPTTSSAVEPEFVATIVASIDAACEAVGCALLGGETAEHPGVMAPDQFDLSTVVLQDGAKFNLARLNAAGVSGLRNVAVEGDLVPAISTAAYRLSSSA